MNKLKETIRSYVQKHPELSEVQIKDEISRQLKGEIFPGEIDEIYSEIVEFISVKVKNNYKCKY